MKENGRCGCKGEAAAIVVQHLSAIFGHDSLKLKLLCSTFVQLEMYFTFTFKRHERKYEAESIIKLQTEKVHKRYILIIRAIYYDAGKPQFVLLPRFSHFVT